MNSARKLLTRLAIYGRFLHEGHIYGFPQSPPWLPHLVCPNSSCIKGPDSAKTVEGREQNYELDKHTFESRVVHLFSGLENFNQLLLLMSSHSFCVYLKLMEYFTLPHLTRMESEQIPFGMLGILAVRLD